MDVVDDVEPCHELGAKAKAYWRVRECESARVRGSHSRMPDIPLRESSEHTRTVKCLERGALSRQPKSSLSTTEERAMAHQTSRVQDASFRMLMRTVPARVSSLDLAAVPSCNIGGHTLASGVWKTTAELVLPNSTKAPGKLFPELTSEQLLLHGEGLRPWFRSVANPKQQKHKCM